MAKQKENSTRSEDYCPFYANIGKRDILLVLIRFTFQGKMCRWKI